MRRNRKIYLRMNLIDLFVCIKERMLLNIEWDEGKQDGGHGQIKYDLCGACDGGRVGDFGALLYGFKHLFDGTDNRLYHRYKIH